MKTLTIYDIKQLTAETAPCFFSEGAMRFFKQTLSDFRVNKIESVNKYQILAGKGKFKTERFFNPITNELDREL